MWCLSPAIAGPIDHNRAVQAWRLASRQHGVISRAQLLELGFTRHAISHRLTRGRLHRVRDGVYAVGRAELTRRGAWMAAILRCSPGSVLSHTSAADLWGVIENAPLIEVTVAVDRHLRPAGIVVHRAALLEGEIREYDGIPVTCPIRTLVDLATRVDSRQLERAVNAADMLDLIDPESLRDAITQMPGRRGVPHLRGVLDQRTFALTDSELERRFLRLVRRAGLPLPETGVRLNGFKVDFHWPELGLVVETDGLRYHRTAAQQAVDRRRDQAHTAAGLTPLRFTHAQVTSEADTVVATLAAVVERCRRTPASGT